MALSSARRQCHLLEVSWQSSVHPRFSVVTFQSAMYQRTATLAALCLAWVQIAHAQNELRDPREGSGADTAVAPLREISGQVRATDPERGEITIQAQTQIFTLLVDASSTIFLAGRIGRLSDLVPGRMVRIAYEETSDGRLVQWIEVPAVPSRSPRAPSAN